MRSLKIPALAATAALAIGLGGISPASAQHFRGGFGGVHGGGFHGGGWHGGGWHGGGWRGRGWGWGPGIAAGVALGTLATAPYWGGYGYYDCPATVVGYDGFGNPILSNACY